MSLSLQTFVLGPESQGRGYRLLAPHTSALPKPSDLAMVLMEWARTHEREFVGGYDLPDGGAVVFRARYQGRALLGEAAYLHGVLIDEQSMAMLRGRPELILDRIPPPDGGIDFAQRPLIVDPPAAPQPPQPGPLGLAWRNRLILTSPGENREAVLTNALASIDPPEQRARITGWVTSGRLESRGGLNLLHNSQLVVAETPFDPATLPGHLPLTHGARDEPGRSIAPPPSWVAWEAFRDSIAGIPAYSGLHKALTWRVQYARYTPEWLADEALRVASGILSPGQMTDLMLNLFQAGGPLSRGTKAFAPVYLEALKNQGVGEQPVYQLLEAIIAADPAGLPLRVLVLAGPAAIDRMSETTLRNLLPYILAVIRKGEIEREPGAGEALVRIIGRAIAALPPQGSELETVCDIVAEWPKSLKGNLLPLTLSDSFSNIYHKSHRLAFILASEVLDRRQYAVSAGETTPVTTLQSVLDAIRVLASR